MVAADGPQADPPHDGQGNLVDHLAGVAGHDGGAEDPVGPLADVDLDEALRLPVEDGAVHLLRSPGRRCHRDALLPRVLLIHADMGDLRVGVGAPGDRQGAIAFLRPIKRALGITMRAWASAVWVNL